MEKQLPRSRRSVKKQTLIPVAILLGGLLVTQTVPAAELAPHKVPIENRVPNYINLDRNRTSPSLKWKYTRFDWVRKADRPFPLKPPSAPFAIRYEYRGRTYGLDDYLRHTDALAFLVLKDDRIVLERYLHGTTSADRYRSYSVMKSIVSLLVGAAVDDGRIRSVQDRIVRYLPYLKKSGFAAATVEDVLRMASGVGYGESKGVGAWTGKPTYAEFAASSPSEIKPGTRFRYKNGDTQVLGLLVERVTGKSLTQYAQEKLWKKIGAESDAFIVTPKLQKNTVAFMGFNASLRDYGRVGLMAMRSGELGGTQVVSESWIRASTTPAPFSQSGPDPKTKNWYKGYGYQWWIPNSMDEDRTFKAMGIHGQTIFVNPAKRIVIAQFSAWPYDNAMPKYAGENGAIFKAIVKKLTDD
jgi:CubicO group peptidase (beta-lactamase class C family)